MHNQFFESRTNTILDEIDMDVTGVSGVAFGGPRRDILFVTVASIILDLFTGKPMEIVTDGSSLYRITGLDTMGPTPTSLKIHEDNP